MDFSKMASSSRHRISSPMVGQQARSPLRPQRKVKTYNPKWLREPLLRPWIRPCPNDPTRVRCPFCNCFIRAHKNCLMEHSKTGKHRRSFQFQSSLPQYNEFVDILAVLEAGKTARQLANKKAKEIHMEANRLSPAKRNSMAPAQSSFAAPGTVATPPSAFTDYSSETTVSVEEIQGNCSAMDVTPASPEKTEMSRSNAGNQKGRNTKMQIGQKKASVSSPNQVSTITEKEASNTSDVDMTVARPKDLPQWEIYPANYILANGSILLEETCYSTTDDDLSEIVCTTTKDPLINGIFQEEPVYPEPPSNTTFDNVIKAINEGNLTVSQLCAISRAATYKIEEGSRQQNNLDNQRDVFLLADSGCSSGSDLSLSPPYI